MHDKKCPFSITITDITGDHFPVLPSDIEMPVIVENDNEFANVGLVTDLKMKPVKQSDGIAKIQVERTGDLNASINVPWNVDSDPEQCGDLKFECGQSTGYSALDQEIQRDLFYVSR